MANVNLLVDRQSAGEILILDRETGKRLFEGPLRQCIHCQFTWIYRPGSGYLSGWCRNCNGFICSEKASCMNCYHKEQRVEDIEDIAFANKRSIEAAVRRRNWWENAFTGGDFKRIR